MLCCGYLQDIAVCFQPVSTHPNSILNVVWWVFARNSCLFVAGQYPSEFYVACCVVGICKQLFVSSRPIPIQILCCMLCCGYLQEIAVCLQPDNTHPNSMLHVVLRVFANSCLFEAGQYPSKSYVACCVVGFCQEYMFASRRTIPMRSLCCMLCCGYLQEIAVCFQPVNTHLNSMLHVVLWVFARHSCLFLAGQYPSDFYVACCVVGFASSCLFLAGQYLSEFYFACCVVGICKYQLSFSSRSIPIRILCCMLCCGYLQIAVLLTGQKQTAISCKYPNTTCNIASGWVLTGQKEKVNFGKCQQHNMQHRIRMGIDRLETNSYFLQIPATQHATQNSDGY